jgi:hypothetical protein
MVKLRLLSVWNPVRVWAAGPNNARYFSGHDGSSPVCGAFDILFLLSINKTRRNSMPRKQKKYINMLLFLE